MYMYMEEKIYKYKVRLKIYFSKYVYRFHIVPDSIRIVKKRRKSRFSFRLENHV